MLNWFCIKSEYITFFQIRDGSLDWYTFQCIPNVPLCFCMSAEVCAASGVVRESGFALASVQLHITPHIAFLTLYIMLVIFTSKLQMHFKGIVQQMATS